MKSLRTILEGPLPKIPVTKEPNMFHGNYGGKGNRGGEPTDELDKVFQRHDVGYHHTKDKTKRLVHDNALIRDTEKIAANKEHPLHIRIKAKMAATLFKTKLKLLVP